MAASYQYKTDPRSRELSFDELEKMLISFSTSALKEKTIENVYESMAKNVIGLLQFVDCVIYSVDDQNQMLIQEAASSAKGHRNNDVSKSLRIGTGIVGSVALTGMPEIVNDTGRDSRYVFGDTYAKSELTIPIKQDDVVIAVIDCEHPEKDFFTLQHLRILCAVASICAIKISHLQAEESIRNKENKLLQLRTQMTELQIKALRAQMNPHFVFNALSAIQHFITVNDKKNALNFLTAFGKLVRLYLRHVEDDSINLVHEIEIIGQYLKLQKLRYEGMFDFNIILDGDQDEDVKVPALITQLIIEEGVENLAKNKVAGSMDIRVHVEYETVKVKIETKIPVSGKDKVSFQKRYENEFTNWIDHIKLLEKLNGYKIETKKFKVSQHDSVNHIISLILPCL